MPVKRETSPKDRRRSVRRKDDVRMAIKALEDTSYKQGDALMRHVQGCERDAAKNLRDNTLLIQMQTEQSATLAAQTVQLDAQTTQLNAIEATQAELQDILPWMKKQYVNHKGWQNFWNAAAEFTLGLVQKNWDAVSGKILLIVIVGFIAIQSGKAINWEMLVKLFGG